MSTPPLVVIVAYRSDEHLLECLGALGSAVDVVVIDNDQADSTRAICRLHGADYVRAVTNVGFATAVNIGLTRADGRDVLLLNPDARIDPDGVLALQSALRDPAHHRAAVGPLLVTEEGRPEPADWPLPSPSQVWADALGLGRWVRGRRFVTGAVLLLRAEAIVEVGGFDERYFLYAEEADWQQRAQAAGWEVAIVPNVTARHAGGASSADSAVRDAHFNASGRAFARRWHGAPGAAAMRMGSVAAAARRVAVGSHTASGRRHLRQQLRSAKPVSKRPAVVHVVRSDGFAGVERSVADIATEQHRRGWRVIVVGGDPVRMRAELPVGVATLPGTTTVQALRSLRRAGRVDVVHAHMTAAELAAAVAKRALGARLVTTRHFAAGRGSSAPARIAGRLIARAIDDQVSISAFVAGAVEAPSVVVPNGVRRGGEPASRTRTVVVMQRLETEKQTDLAIRAWALSGLGDDGWRLVVHGRGSQEEALRRLVDDLSVADSVELAGFTDDARSVLAGAGLLLATAPAEPFGLTVAEAMAEGAPVVAADGGAHREVLGDDGRYFPPGDATRAAAALRDLAALSDNDRATLGKRLRERQQVLFSIERQVTDLLRRYQPAAPRVALLSLETWDEVWRRNQHFASRLVRDGATSSLLFVTPPAGGLALRAVRRHPEPGIAVVTPPLLVPRRLGGHRVLALWLRRAVRGADLVWVNDPVAGAATLRPGRPVVYDVTDDWRELDQPSADRSRIVAAENVLARVAATVACSPSLVARWRERYGVEATLIGNGVDLAAINAAQPRTLTGPGPHLVYVGTAHPSRIDVPLLRALVDHVPGTLHLVGPEGLNPADRRHLEAGGAQIHGPVPSTEVPSWLSAADVLVCPHVVDEFTLSLDAIKAYEYLATSAPVVATPSSGFQDARAPGLTVASAGGFVAAVHAAVGTGPWQRTPPPDWDDRAIRFAAVLQSASHATAGQ